MQQRPSSSPLGMAGTGRGDLKPHRVVEGLEQLVDGDACPEPGPSSRVPNPPGNTTKRRGVADEGELAGEAVPERHLDVRVACGGLLLGKLDGQTDRGRARVLGAPAGGLHQPGSTPGPEKSRRPSTAATFRASAHSGPDAGVRAEPNTETAPVTAARASKAVASSAAIRRIRSGSPLASSGPHAHSSSSSAVNPPSCLWSCGPTGDGMPWPRASRGRNSEVRAGGGAT